MTHERNFTRALRLKQYVSAISAFETARGFHL